LNGVHRNADVGLLYDPQRKREKAFCKIWLTELVRQDPELKIRMNYPYRGTTDGFTTWLRKRHDEFQYVGVELEVNQNLVNPAAQTWLKLKQALASSLGASYQQLDMASG
jgi:predicted N-formylglutamate amidohydrolase